MVQLHAQRKQRRMELEAEAAAKAADRDSAERAKKIEMETKIYDSLEIEIQRNIQSLRDYHQRPIKPGEKEEILALAGIQRVVDDPIRAAYLSTGPRRDYFEQVQRIYETMVQYNKAVRQEPDPAKRRQIAKAFLDTVAV